VVAGWNAAGVREQFKDAVTDPPRDNDAYRFPVSVKGVILRDGSVVLLENDRDEWELPGGKLEPSESPELCLTREIEEELQIAIEPDTLLDSWIYTIAPGIHVLILTYGCSEPSERQAVLSHEHKQLRWFPLAEVDSLRMPDGYKASIRCWAAIVASHGASRTA
jgi:8-oxo-dGTP pyrophosphatase MutT (NUDIX family)